MLPWSSLEIIDFMKFLLTLHDDLYSQEEHPFLFLFQ